MNTTDTQEEAVEMLQQLGLKEYEAKCFVALTRVPKATAKEISNIADVPRTRVYDANRILEAKGLVEVQHTNPQQFRAVSIEEASETLRKEYAQRIESLESRLAALDSFDRNDDSDTVHEVWSLSSEDAVTTRTTELISEAQDEVLLFVGDEAVFTSELVDAIELATGRGVSVRIGTPTESFRAEVADTLPETAVFVTERSVLLPDEPHEDDGKLTRLLLVDQSAILVSTTPDHAETTAVCGRGFNNGLVALVRRLLTSELGE